MNEIQEKQLVRQAKRGDQDAFVVLVSHYSPRIRLAIRHYIDDQPSIEDVLQESLASAYRNLKTFKEESRFYTWLYRIAINTAVNTLKKRGCVEYVDFEQPFIKQKIYEISQQSFEMDPKNIAEGLEIREALDNAIKALPEDLRSLLIYCEIFNLSQEELAGMLSLPPGTLRSRLHRAREKVVADAIVELCHHRPEKIQSAYAKMQRIKAKSR